MERKVVHVKVTKQDIRLGKKGNVFNCPIALALKRIGKKNICVEGYCGWFKGMANTAPSKASHFIDRFDLSRKVKPISFNLYEDKE